MIKRQVLLILVIGIVAAWPAFSEVTDPAGTFSIDPPPGWTARTDKKDPSADIRLVAPAEKGYTANVGFQTITESFALTPAAKKKFRRSVESELTGRNIPCKFVGEKDITIGGAPAWKLSYRVKMEDVEVTGYSIVVARARKTWIITFLSSAATFEKNSQLFDDALKTFRIL